jgi:hypothetical protein
MMNDFCHCHQDTFCDRHQLVKRKRYDDLTAENKRLRFALSDVRDFLRRSGYDTRLVDAALTLPPARTEGSPTTGAADQEQT